MGVQPADCIVVEDSPVGVAAGVAAGMKVIGFVGGSHAGVQLAAHLRRAGARAVISDMRALKGTIIDLFAAGNPRLCSVGACAAGLFLRLATGLALAPAVFLFRLGAERIEPDIDDVGSISAQRRRQRVADIGIDMGEGERGRPPCSRSPISRPNFDDDSFRVDAFLHHRDAQGHIDRRRGRRPDR